jgi:hypothetical protein
MLKNQFGPGDSASLPDSRRIRLMLAFWEDVGGEPLLMSWARPRIAKLMTHAGKEIRFGEVSPFPPRPWPLQLDVLLLQRLVEKATGRSGFLAKETKAHGRGRGMPQTDGITFVVVEKHL